MISGHIASAKHSFSDQSVTNDYGGIIKGTTQKIGSTLSCLVRIYEKSSGRLIDQKYSNTDGDYKFINLKIGIKYTIIGFDPKSEFNAVIQDNVVLK